MAQLLIGQLMDYKNMPYLLFKIEAGPHFSRLHMVCPNTHETQTVTVPTDALHDWEALPSALKVVPWSDNTKMGHLEAVQVLKDLALVLTFRDLMPQGDWVERVSPESSYLHSDVIVIEDNEN